RVAPRAVLSGFFSIGGGAWGLPGGPGAGELWAGAGAGTAAIARPSTDPSAQAGLTIDRKSIRPREFRSSVDGLACMKSERAWAIESFGHADLGDERRTRRLVGMARRAARSPAGRGTEVFCQPAESQARYDCLEHEAVSADAVSEALCGATAKLSRRQDRVFVVLDGTSLSLSDRDGAKEFGSLGPGYKNGKGLKVLNALALTQEGAAVGV